MGALILSACGPDREGDAGASASGLAAPNLFVTTNGLELQTGNRPFFFQGTNFYDIGLLTPDHSEQEVYAAMRALADRGLGVVRLWGFSCGTAMYTGTPIIQRITGGQIQYNEAALQRLDLTLDAARSAHVKIILALVNFEPEYCGMGWWVNEITGAQDKQLFYTHADVKELYKQHVTNMLERVNTRYQSARGETVAYKDDPTIMAIEPANEPHTEDAYEQDLGLPAGAIVRAWLREITDHIRSVDTQHLITTGEEGWKIAHSTENGGNRHRWMHDGLKGVDFEGNAALPNVDVITVHVYPDNMAVPAEDITWVREHVVEDRAAIAHRLGKPIILEESGFDTSPRFARLGYHTSPAVYQRLMFKYANAARYAGTMVWQALPPGYGAGSGYNFDFNAPQFAVVQDQARCMTGKNLGIEDCTAIADATEPALACSDVPPDDLYSCAQQAAWGQCEQEWMSVFCNASCGRCTGPTGAPACSDVPPDNEHTCAQQTAWGKCEETWMTGFCNASCGRCTAS